MKIKLIKVTLFVNHVKTTLNVIYYEDEKILNLSGKRITDFCEETVFPEGIKKLNICHNRIVNLDGRDGKFRFPESLTNLWITYNQISDLDGRDGKFRFPESLTDLDISYNQITNIDGRDGKFRFSKFTTKLSIAGNQIVNLDGRDGKFRFPESLTVLYIFYNKIVNLDGCSGTFRFPESLTDLYISYNQITNLSLSVTNLRRLVAFDYSDNPIENVHPVVQRFIERIENRDYSSKSVYEDKQNVHDIKVQNSTRDSLQKIMIYEQKLQTSKFDETLISHLNTKEIHSFFGVTEREVLSYVENAISSKSYSQDTQEQLYSLLKEAIEEGKGVCSTGKIGRMVNVLSGFDPNVNIQISDKAQISAIILEFRKRNEPRENVEKELLSRNISEEEIKEWLEYY